MSYIGKAIISETKNGVERGDGLFFLWKITFEKHPLALKAIMISSDGKLSHYKTLASSHERQKGVLL